MMSEIFPSTPECEIRSERILQFARELVFNAWAEPGHLKNWWGPKGLQTLFTPSTFAPVVSGASPCMDRRRAIITMNVNSW